MKLLRQLKDDNKYIAVRIDDYTANTDYNADFNNTSDVFAYITETPELSDRVLKLSRPTAAKLINEAIGWGWTSYYDVTEHFEVTISIEECS